MGKTYDPRCYDIAELFLSDTPLSTANHRDELASLIQQTIEDYIAHEERRSQSSTGCG